jgi:hypothetical protein
MADSQNIPTDDLDALNESFGNASRSTRSSPPLESLAGTGAIEDSFGYQGASAEIEAAAAEPINQSFGKGTPATAASPTEAEAIAQSFGEDTGPRAHRDQAIEDSIPAMRPKHVL